MDDGIKKIITVEDPVEYQMPNITQIQTHAEIGYTFARALRAILRHDPNIIMIGEIRDAGDGRDRACARRSPATWCSPRYTPTTRMSSFTRLIDMGLEPYLVGSTPSAASRRSAWCANAAASAAPVPVDLAGLRWRTMQLKPTFRRRLLGGNAWVQAWKAANACQHTGYRGRTGIYELVPMSGELQDMIVAGASHNDLKRFAAARKHRNLFQDGLVKASHGRTTLDEVTRLTLTDN